MLPKKYRLRLKNDFDKLFKGGKFAGQALFTLGFIKNGMNISRFAVIVGKKVSKKAVTRNSIKRRTVEVIRLNLKQIKSGYDILFIAKNEAQKMKYKEIEEDMGRLFKKTRLIE